MLSLTPKFLQRRYKPPQNGLGLDFEKSPFGVVSVDATTGRFTQVNTLFATLVGRESASLIGTRWFDLGIGKAPSDPSEAPSSLSLDKPPADAWTECLAKADGTEVLVEVSFLTSVQDSQGGPIWVLIVKDIADRLEEQARLRVSEQRHRVVADSARDVIWSMSPLGEITYVSPAVEKLRGLTPEEAMNTPLDKTLTPDSAAVSVQYFMQVAQAVQLGRKPNSFQGELEYIRKDGSTFWTECLSFPLMDSKGALVEIVGVTRDISERKHHEDSLREALLQAEKANLAKTRFLGHISHEIRTPLSAMLALNDLLLNSDVDEKQRAWLNQSQDAGRLLQGMINDILDFSKMESGQLALVSKPFELNAVLQQVDQMVASVCADKGLDFKIEVAPDLPMTWCGDASRLTQSLMNLVGNAVKFTDRGHVAIRVQRMEQDAGLECLRFTVEDTGAGLSLAMQSEAFDGFVRGDHELVGEHAGAGLGLSICQRLVKLMGGEMGVESVPGQGSTFWFTVRLKAQSQLASAQETGVSSAMAAQALAGLRILLVDDNQSIREIVKQLLQLAQVRVDTAENGVVALAMLKDTRYDLVLMDLQMPVMGGLEATRRIRQDPALAKLPIVALTAGGLASELDQLKADGITDYLGKPFDYQKLLEVLSRNVPTDQQQSV